MRIVGTTGCLEQIVRRVRKGHAHLFTTPLSSPRPFLTIASNGTEGTPKSFLNLPGSNHILGHVCFGVCSLHRFPSGTMVAILIS